MDSESFWFHLRAVSVMLHLVSGCIGMMSSHEYIYILCTVFVMIWLSKLSEVSHRSTRSSSVLCSVQRWCHRFGGQFLMDSPATEARDGSRTGVKGWRWWTNGDWEGVCVWHMVTGVTSSAWGSWPSALLRVDPDCVCVCVGVCSYTMTNDPICTPLCCCRAKYWQRQLLIFTLTHASCILAWC